MGIYTVRYVETEMIDRAKETAVYETNVIAKSIEDALAYVTRYELEEYYTVVAVIDERYD